MATGRRESTRLFCCSLLLVVSVVQLLATGQWSETLCQGALTRFDSRIELQRKQQEKLFIITYLVTEIFDEFLFCNGTCKWHLTEKSKSQSARG